MQKYKIKILPLILVIGLIAAVTYLALPYLLFNLADYYTHQEEQKEKGQILYQRIVKYFPHSWAAADSLYWLALSITPPYNSSTGSSIIITKHMTSGSTTTTEGPGIKVAINSYKTLYEKYPESDFAEFVPLRLGELYYGLGEYEKAEEYLLQGLTQDARRKFIQSECTHKLIELYLKKHEPKKALEMYQKYREDNPTSMIPHIYLLEGDAYRQLGDFKKAEASYLKVLENLPSDEENLDLMETRNYLSEEVAARLAKNKLEKENKNKTKGTIQGEVFREGAPLENVQIYLIDENITRNGFSSLEIEQAPSTFTDLWGRFEFTDINPGRYSLGLGIPVSYLNGYTLVPRPEKIIEVGSGDENFSSFKLVPLIKTISPEKNSYQSVDKITFHWEPVPQAAYYQLELGAIERSENGIGFASGIVMDNIQDNKIIIADSQLNQNRGISYDEQGITPHSLLGTLYPGGEFIWNVKACAADGTFLKESLGYQFHIDKSNLPIFLTDSADLSEGDKLILERKYDQALSYFQRELAEMPNDLHALNMLSRLHQYHTEDIEKATRYLEKLYRLTDSNAYLNKLALHLYHNKEYKQALPYLELLVSKDAADWYILYSLGRSYLITGNMQLGEKYFSQSAATKECTRIDPVIFKAAKGDWTGAYQTLEELNTDYITNYGSLHRAINDFVETPPQLAGTNWQETIINFIKDREYNQPDTKFKDPRLNEFIELVIKSI